MIDPYTLQKWNSIHTVHDFLNFCEDGKCDVMNMFLQLADPSKSAYWLAANINFNFDVKELLTQDNITIKHSELSSTTMHPKELAWHKDRGYTNGYDRLTPDDRCMAIVKALGFTDNASVWINNQPPGVLMGRHVDSVSCFTYEGLDNNIVDSPVSIESSALKALRLIREKSISVKHKKVNIEISPILLTCLETNHENEIKSIKEKHGVEIEMKKNSLLPNDTIEVNGEKDLKKKKKSLKQEKIIGDMDYDKSLRQPKELPEIYRCFVALEDWQPGQIVNFEPHYWEKWKKGDVVFFDWRNTIHSTANTGEHHRPLLKVTGTVQDDSYIKLAKETGVVKNAMVV